MHTKTEDGGSKLHGGEALEVAHASGRLVGHHGGLEVETAREKLDQLRIGLGAEKNNKCIC